jgi:hypothetical protein
MIREREASGVQRRFKVDSMPVRDGSGRGLQGAMAGLHATLRGCLGESLPWAQGGSGGAEGGGFSSAWNGEAGAWGVYYQLLM